MSVPTGFPGVTNTNQAGDNANVEQQIGAIYGGTFHRNETTYNFNASDPPERKFQVALNHLRGGTARQAEAIFEDLLHHGDGSTHLAYYYALSVLSDRSLNEIGEDVYLKFRAADLTAQRFVADAWSVALTVVWELISCVWRQEIGEALDAEHLKKALANFRALPKDRQGEITRHLALVLGGALQDSLAAEDAQRVREERLQPDRAGRAWKFFEPDPALPRYFVTPATAVPASEYAKPVLGAVGVAIGLLVFLTSFAAPNPGVAIVALVIFAGGVAAAFWGSVERELATRRLVERDREHGVPLQFQAAVSPGHWVRTDFVTQIHRLVEARFTEARPHIAGSWVNDTRGMCEYYKWRFVASFGNAQVDAGAVDWLIRWHAQRAAAQWQAGTLFAYRDQLRVPGSAVAVHRLGLGVMGFAALLMLGGQGGFAAAAVFLALGGFFALKGAVGVFAGKRFRREEELRARRLLEEEQQAHREWVEVLADRPDDAEMAQWLNLDKTFLKTEALRRSRLTNRDLVTHVVLNEGAANARRARVMGGPMRYSRYVVLLFLLSESGVREIEIELDFLTGNVHNEQRKSFRYDALAAAEVAEVGVRYADGWRYQIVGDHSTLRQDESVRKRALRLSLVSGQQISVVAEGFEGLSDELESQTSLQELAFETSGIASALHVLEAVSAEGRDWIAREQERRRRRSEDWRLRDRGPGLLDGGSGGPEDEG
ncbi:hypothetical protein VA596_03660 [Amycolatopsis sp., V23-08]|uniref:Uncharacterized protein n=1 Tax=Amycolatopsis heterodermiae TaxID=3110235 RepID=A0ABU5QXF7_9PSEU|nr:hypothetical protein [Amycolatopsis sp., V23-08]MEA5358620.1 hypothetical protein [Amycolatopsis sp., V23-08]